MILLAMSELPHKNKGLVDTFLVSLYQKYVVVYPIGVKLSLFTRLFGARLTGPKVTTLSVAYFLRVTSFPLKIAFSMLC